MQTQVPGARAEAKLSMDPVLMDEIQQVCECQLSGCVDILNSKHKLADVIRGY